MDRLRLVFVILAIVYSVVWIGGYWAGERERPVSTKYHSTPIETTTAEERARGESSFEIARGHQFGITRAGFFGFFTIGYVVLLVAFAIASLVLRPSPT